MVNRGWSFFVVKSYARRSLADSIFLKQEEEKNFFFINKKSMKWGEAIYNLKSKHN